MSDYSLATKFRSSRRETGYRVLKFTNLSDLENAVNDCLLAGYIACGGVSCWYDSKVGATYSQAVVMASITFEEISNVQP